MSALPGPGERIGDKYEIVRVLGKGGMGIVYEAIHRRLDQRFAIKMLLPEALSRADAVARFDREARAAARLRSPHVVRVIDVDTDTARGGAAFLVMEYVEGHDLSTEIKRRGAIPVVEAVDWLLEACLGVHEAHARGIIHRDLKPSNLFLSDENGQLTVKVMDFGISKVASLASEGDLTETDMTLGTTNYMAPEQMLAPKTIDHRVDIWSLGVVLYRMLSNTLPFAGETQAALAVAVATTEPCPIHEHAPHLPPALAAAVMAALTRSRDRRPADAMALARLLEPFGSGRVRLSEQLAAMPASARIVAAGPPSSGELDGTLPLNVPSSPRQAPQEGISGPTPLAVERGESGAIRRVAEPPSSIKLPAIIGALTAVVAVSLSAGLGGWALRTRAAQHKEAVAAQSSTSEPPARSEPSSNVAAPPPESAATAGDPPARPLSDAGGPSPRPPSKSTASPGKPATVRPAASAPSQAPAAADPLHL